MSLSHQVRHALEASPGEGMTMSQIMTRAGILKTQSAEVSSALHKLSGRGLVLSARGPATSVNGPRFVRNYRWGVKAVKKAPEAAVAHPLADVCILRT